MYTTAFMSSNLNAAMPKMQRVLRELFSAIDRKCTHEPIDIQELSVRLTLDTIGEMAFALNLGGLDGSRPLLELVRSVAEIGVQRMFNPLKKAWYALFPYTKEAKRQAAEIKALGDQWDGLLAEIVAKEDPPEGVEPIWYTLKKLADPDTGKPLDKDLIRGEMATVVIAGMETTGHQLAWTLAVLAAYPQVVEKILGELTDHGFCEPVLKAFALDDFAELTYLSAVVKEGLRLVHIAGSIDPRVVPKDMKILGYRIPKGTIAICPGNSGYSTEADWGDPNIFSPERWLTGEDMSHKYYLPFSTGPRDCPGQRLTALELRLSIAEIVRRYEFSLVGTYADLKAKEAWGAVVECPGGIWMNFSPRRKHT